MKRGQLVARVGNSGDARVPHLHFQVAPTPDFLAGESLPYQIKRFGSKTDGRHQETRTSEFPLDAGLIEFDGDSGG